jgi:hypothetical protein
MSSSHPIIWPFAGSPDMPGNLAKNWKNEDRRSSRKFHESIGEAESFLAREAIQNMVDARMSADYRKASESFNGPFKIKARFVTFHQEECAKVLKNLGLDEKLLNEKTEQQKLSSGDQMDKDLWAQFLKNLNKIIKAKKLRVLYLEEEATSGMYASNVRDNLIIAMYSHNQGNPNAGAGGSFGHGKGAIARASKLRMNVAYTNTDWCQAPHNSNRLMGVLYMPSFWSSVPKGGSAKHSGFGLLTKKFESRDYIEGKVPVPFSGPEADELAQNLGMAVRKSRNNGTTMMIVEPDFEPDDFRKAVELNWLPALVNSDLSVEIIEEERGTVAPTPTSSYNVDPLKNTSLSGLCAAQLLLSNSDVVSIQESTNIKIIEHKVYEQPGVGKLSIVAHVHVGEFQPQIVYSRSRNIGLVIRHNHKNGTLPTGIDVRAHFQADPKLNDILRKSEPKTHDEWASGIELNKDDKEAVLSVDTHIKESINDFLRNLNKGLPTDEKELDILSGIFNNMFGSKGKKTTEKKRRRNPSTGTKPSIKITFKEEVIHPLPSLTVDVDTEHDVNLIAVLEVLNDDGMPYGWYNAGQKQFKKGKTVHTFQLLEFAEFICTKPTDTKTILLDDALSGAYRMRWSFAKDGVEL